MITTVFFQKEKWDIFFSKFSGIFNGEITFYFKKCSKNGLISEKILIFEKRLDFSKKDLIFPKKTWFFKKKIDFSKTNLIFPKKNLNFQKKNLIFSKKVTPNLT